ncbi:MAG TPA: CHAD domain-containing protein, partial [Blastocatellia bacterium]|nr:CHAD domain-containing protein [Blastocatellia bacterium]
AAKRLRYLMEITSLMGFGTAPSALNYLKSIQDRIGDWHDLHALEEEILGIVSRRKFVRKNLAECSTMLRAALHLQKKKEALVAKLFPVRIPKTVAVSAGRFARALRRPQAARAMPQRPDSTSEH